MPQESESTVDGGWQEAVDKYYPFLIEIRRRLIWLGIWFAVFALLGFAYYEQIVTFSLQIFRLEGVNFVFTSQFQFISLAISSAFAVAMIATFPLVIIQILSFLQPALRAREFRFVLMLVPVAIIFFLAGFFYGVVVMKYVVGLFYQAALQLDVGNLLDVSSFLSQIITTATLMGVAFEFPIVLTALLKLKVLEYQTVSSKRPIVYFACLLFAALLPPTDVLSLALLTAPLIVLFESTLFINKVFLRVSTET
ncbi:hypothetical protein A2797_01755 [candidate division WWE3 bacterium RIFCSPHIGHO2_01_FULL_48_15]|uniref:Sec-independent protein translocase protein TatC n=1 Tax=candidate division WWE3 bacterium RIFCSPHIGHO2_01_FULL_48_15 TaxID=1802619 RepID=A0A1F4VBH3_UNCKA|nr:MAG: hypothetical protein A2797_01755 [candidate division WWE3 bacterium RIFCSPHIGHO2_01_FULL_48_15]